MIVVLCAVLLIAAVVALANGGGREGDEGAARPITGTKADQARAVAVRFLHGGHATGVAQDLGSGGYGVDVVRRDGRNIEVRLDRNLHPLGTGSLGGDQGEAGGGGDED